MPCATRDGCQSHKFTVAAHHEVWSAADTAMAYGREHRDRRGMPCTCGGIGQDFGLSGETDHITDNSIDDPLVEPEPVGITLSVHPFCMRIHQRPDFAPNEISAPYKWVKVVNDSSWPHRLPHRRRAARVQLRRSRPPPTSRQDRLS
jgi:hypothetical protein